jgi:shikimate dehydrogenase
MIDRYAVIGNPIAHSKSPIIHAAFAEATRQALDYGAIEGPLGGFDGAVDDFRAAGGRGLNVTAPFKLDAFAYATVLHERARQAGAVNCLRFDGDRVEADNFDGIGLVRDIMVNLATPVGGRRVLMLGAGGAARGALAPILSAAPASLVVANRTRAKAVDLATAFAGVEPTGLDELADHDGFDIVINATSAGLHGDTLAVPETIFRPDSLAYDMTYGKGLTGFLRVAQQAGVRRLHDGVGMLAEQAAEAFAWWRGVRPDTRRVIEQLTVPLA